MAVSHPASALGEATGKLIEDEIERIIRPICERRSYVYDRGGLRPEKRKGVNLSMVNSSGNKYQLDGVIENPSGELIVLLESKYLRYKKHNRDKASWTCASHYSLRKTYPTIRKSIAILSGNWTKPSKLFLESFGIELFEIPFRHMVDVFHKYDLNFVWDEKDRITPTKSWFQFNDLNANDKLHLSKDLLDNIRNGISKSIIDTLDSGEGWIQRLNEIELLLKTDRHEYFNRSFKTIGEILQYLISLQDEAKDLRGRI